MAALAVATIGVLKRKRRDPAGRKAELELQKLEYEIDELKQENQWLKTRLGGLSRIAPTLASFVSLAALVATFVVAFATWQTTQSTLKKAGSDIVMAETKQFSDLIQTASDSKRSPGERIGAIWVLDGFWGDENIRDAPKVLTNALTAILIEDVDESPVGDACEGVIRRAYQGVTDPLRRRQITASFYGSQPSIGVGLLLTERKRLVKRAKDPANGPDQKRLSNLDRVIIATAGNLKYEDLRGADLQLITLKGIDFSRADLSSATLTEATLSGTNLESANLESANLNSANLDFAANLNSANLQYAKLESANLRSANLEYAKLQSANLQSANLQYANLRSAKLQSANLQYANLQGVNLINARLEGAVLEGADLEGAKVADPMDLKDVKGTFGGKVIFGGK